MKIRPKAGMDPAERKFVRAIVRQVHPDLFAAYPYERAKNSEALKVLNVYADQLSQGLRPEAAHLTFYVRQGEGLSEVSAELPSYGSLGPLFYAFGLISQDELREGFGACSGQGADDRDLAAWLRETVGEAVRTADQHDSLKRVIRDMRMNLESRFRLAAVQVGGEFAISSAEQRRQIDSLKALDACLTSLAAKDPDVFEGLSIRLYHPDSRPLGTKEYVDFDGSFNLRQQPITSHVADNGVVHVVADPDVMAEALPRLDLGRARLLAKLGSFWMQRSRDLCNALQAVLGVEAVWCDTRSEDSSQQFVLWAGAVLEQRAEFEAKLAGRRFAFSLLAHSDPNSPMLDFLAPSSVLQVRCDCPPPHLLDFLCSSAGISANEAAAQVADTREEEEMLLAAVREALGAKHVIRVCSSYDQEKVLRAAQRLLECAPAIRSAVDLSGASLAIDDCYEIWDSGFISIPHDFNLSDLQPKLQALLSSGSSASAAANGATNGYAAAAHVNGNGYTHTNSNGNGNGYGVTNGFGSYGGDANGVGAGYNGADGSGASYVNGYGGHVDGSNFTGYGEQPSYGNGYGSPYGESAAAGSYSGSRGGPAGALPVGSRRPAGLAVGPAGLHAQLPLLPRSKQLLAPARQRQQRPRAVVQQRGVAAAAAHAAGRVLL